MYRWYTVNIIFFYFVYVHSYGPLYIYKIHDNNVYVYKLNTYTYATASNSLKMYL